MAGPGGLVAIDPPLHTAAWYGDRPAELGLPADWDVTVHWPTTPPPLSDIAVRQALREPIGQPDLAGVARGARRVVVVVDDLSRPTPVDRILPHVVEELGAAGVRDDAIEVLIATGTHGPSRAGVERKVGPAMAGRLRVGFHDDLHDVARLGTTSFGSPVFVNHRVAGADLVIGIGGIYPQHTVGFGGGTKIILGVLGRRSIERLHFRHPGVEGRRGLDSSFRRDVTEMAAMAGLRVSISAMVDARRQLVWVRSGDPAAYFDAACDDAAGMFLAPPPGDADVVIANAYPMDLSATFVRSKGIVPLTHAGPRASRVLVGAASEGIGHHGLFPLADGRRERLARVLRVARNVERAELVRLVRRRLRRPPAGREPGAPPSRPIIFHPTGGGRDLPDVIAAMSTIRAWNDVLRRIAEEQRGVGRIRAVVYPCSPLQVVEG